MRLLNQRVVIKRIALQKLKHVKSTIIPREINWVLYIYYNYHVIIR